MMEANGHLDALESLSDDEGEEDDEEEEEEEDEEEKAEEEDKNQTVIKLEIVQPLSSERDTQASNDSSLPQTVRVEHSH